MDLSRNLQDKLASARGNGFGLHVDDAPASPRSSSPPRQPRPSASLGGSSLRSGGGSARLVEGGDGSGASVLELGELTVHQYFGERALLEGKHKGTHTASVVSITPVEVLLLSKYDFYHCVDAKTQALMLTYADKFYFDEERIRRSIQKQFKWDAYKQELLKDVLSPRASPRGGSTPRGGGSTPVPGGRGGDGGIWAR